MAAAAKGGPLVGAGLSQHAVYVGADGVRLVNTSAAPVRGPRDVLFAPFADLARHLDHEVRVSLMASRRCESQLSGGGSCDMVRAHTGCDFSDIRGPLTLALALSLTVGGNVIFFARLQLRKPPAAIIATRDDLLALALAAHVVALYRSRLPRDPYALSKPLELQVRPRDSASPRALTRCCPACMRKRCHDIANLELCASSSSMKAGHVLKTTPGRP
jgi:hypothetical protein